jgi:LPS export ABC transporter permease LptG
LDAYIFSELHAPFFMAMVLYNGIFFIRTLTKIAQFAADFQVPGSLLLMMLLSFLPNMLALTLPISLLFGAQAAAGRLSSDSEIIAPLSAGLSFWRLNRGVFAYGLLLSALSSLLVHWIEPAMYQVVEQRYRQFLHSSAVPSVTPGVIKPLGGESVLYFEGQEKNTLHHLLFISQEDQQERLTFAQSAQIVTEPEGGWRFLLEGATVYALPEEEGDQVQIFESARLERGFSSSLVKAGKTLQYSESEKQTSFALFLRFWQGQPVTTEEQIILGKRWAYGITPFLFAFFAFPFSARHSRFRKGSGFGKSLFIIGGYFYLLGRLRSLAEHDTGFVVLSGTLPPLILLVLGLILNLGHNRDWWMKGEEKRAAARIFLVRWFRKLSGLFSKGSKEEAFRSVTRRYVPLRFPNKFDRYLVAHFAKVFLMVQLSVLVLVVLIEYTQMVNWLQKSDASSEVVAKYFLFIVPEFFDTTFFLCLLIGVLVTLAQLSRSQEITAFRAAGGNLLRLAMPLVLIGLSAMVFSSYLQNSILPWANRQSVVYKDRIRNREPVLFTRNVWLKTSEHEILNFAYYDRANRSLHKVRRYTMDPILHGTLSRETYETLTLSQDHEQQWEVAGVSQGMTFQREGGALKFQPVSHPSGKQVHLGITATDLAQKKRHPNEFSLEQLKAYQHYLSSLGYDAKEFDTEYLSKLVKPLLPLFMVLFAVPLGFQFGRKGSVYGVGIGLVIGLVVWGLMELTKSFGATGALPSWLAAWGILAPFSLFALIRFFRLKDL